MPRLSSVERWLPGFGRSRRRGSSWPLVGAISAGFAVVAAAAVAVTRAGAGHRLVKASGQARELGTDIVDRARGSLVQRTAISETGEPKAPASEPNSADPIAARR